MAKLLTQLSLLRFFPSQPEMRQALADYIEQFANTDEELDWLGKEMIRLYREWPSVAELRALFCSKFQPKDGLNNLPTCAACGEPITPYHAMVDGLHGECWLKRKGVQVELD